MLKINDLKIGDSNQFEVSLTTESHNLFREFSGDYSPIHNDNNFAKSVGFNEKIAYGFHIISYFSRLYGEYLPGGSSVCLSQSVKYTKPVYLNQKIIVKGTITNINKNMKVITIKNEIIDEKGEICITGEALLRMIVD